jgi:GT2 family glycosyltransferase
MKVLVRDGDEVFTNHLDSSWTVIQGPEKFSMAGNGNLALRGAPPYSDILYCGDDVRFLTADTTKVLQEQAYSDSTIGILTPRIIGRGSAPQISPRRNLDTVKPLDMWFPCVFLKRELIDKIGYLDEDFNEFGSDDYDYCLRTVKAGYRLAVTTQVSVEHEAAPNGGPTTFMKKLGSAEWQRQQRMAFRKLRAKHGRIT